MSGPYKIDGMVGDDWKPVVYSNSYAVSKTSGSDRLVVTVSENQVDLIVDFLQLLEEPFGILYVLVVSRLGHADGRYQSPQPISRAEAIEFLRCYQDYLEKDGRHHIWVHSIPTDSTIVYDNHNLIYCYGDIDKLCAFLKSKNFEDREESIPSPHAHRYNEEFDLDEDRIVQHWEWNVFDLVPDVDDP